MRNKYLRGVAVSALMGFSLMACAGTIHENADGTREYFSGASVPVKLPPNIPGVPESATPDGGMKVRWATIEIDQYLYLDASCQDQLFNYLPGWAQAIVKEGGWGALATAVGEGAFASAFPGVEITRYVLGGLGFGAAVGANTGRYRQDGAEKASAGYCTTILVYLAQNKYGILEDVGAIPWYGNGRTTLPEPTPGATIPARTAPQGNRRPPLPPP